MLSGDMVNLRPLSMDDLPARLEMVNNPEVQRVTVGCTVDQNTLNDLKAWLKLVSQDPFSMQWAVETKDGKYIGDIDLHSINVIRGEAWISPMIGDPDYMQNPAYRREAIALAAQYAFQEKNIERLAIDLPDVDEQGLHILDEMGFRRVEEMEFDMLTGVKTVTLELHPQDMKPPLRQMRA